MASKYNIVIKAVLNKADLYKQIKDVEKGLKNSPITVTTNIPKVTSQINKATQSTFAFSRSGKTLGQAFSSVADKLGNAMAKMALWKIAGDMVFGTLQKIEQSIQFVDDLNMNLTKLQYVTGQTTEEVYKTAEGYKNLAGNMRVTINEVAEGSLEWARQGKSAKESLMLTEQSITLATLGNLEAAQATEYLTSTLNGFKLSAEDASLVVDKLISLDNNFATSAGEIAVALQKSANTAQIAGVDFDTLAAYITVVSSVTRKSADTIGNSFKTIFTRMQAVKQGGAFDDMGEDLSKVESTLRTFGIEIRDQNNDFRDMKDVLDEIASKWEDMSTIQKSSIAGAVAGTWQRENFLTLMENYNLVGKAIAEEKNAQGLSRDRMEDYFNSIEGHMKRLQTMWDTIWVSEDWVKFRIQFLDLFSLITYKFGKLFNIEFAPEEEISYNERYLKLIERDLAKSKEKIGDKEHHNQWQAEMEVENLQKEVDRVKKLLAEAKNEMVVASGDGIRALKELGEGGVEALEKIGSAAKSGLPPTRDELEKTTAETYKGFLDVAKGAKELVNSYNASSGATAEQIMQLQALFPAQYTEILYIDQNTGLIQINIEALKRLTIAKGLAAQETINSALAIDSENQVLRQTLALLNAKMGELQQQAYWIPQVSSATKELSDNEEAYNDLVEMTVKMLKKKAEQEKDALKEELDGYKKIIDARKKILDQQKDEADYQDDLKEKNKELSDIEAELLEIQFDDSEWAKKRRLELEAEKADKITEIEKLQRDKSIDDQKDALDKEYERYKDYIDAKIDELDRYLDEEGNLTQEAMELLKNRTDAFYQQLLEWNRVYGTGIDKDVIEKWNTAFNSVITYSNGAAGGFQNMKRAAEDTAKTLSEVIQLSGDAIKNLKEVGDYGGYTPKKHDPLKKEKEWGEEYHSGGIAGGIPTVKESETLAVLLKGEPVLSIPQTKYLVNTLLPNIASLGGAGDTSILLNVNVQGNLDKDVLPEFENKVLNIMNKAMKKRGLKPSVSSYSI